MLPFTPGGTTCWLADFAQSAGSNVMPDGSGLRPEQSRIDARRPHAGDLELRPEAGLDVRDVGDVGVREVLLGGLSGARMRSARLRTR